MKNKKSQFLQAVELLAPGEKLVRELAKSIPENLLPAYPGATALEFVAGLHGLKTGRACPRRSVGLKFGSESQVPASQTVQDARATRESVSEEEEPGSCPIL